MARNPRADTKTTVTPNFRPVDTFVQPAPVDNTRLKELSSFLNNMIPRVERYAQIEQGRRDKKDVLKAQEAFAKVTDKLLEYDELVKDGQLPPDQSPMFRFAFNQQQGAQAGLEFIRQANEAYIRSALPKATSSSGFNDWFSNLQKDFVENNNAILRGTGSFDAFSGYANQAQQNLLTSHLSSVKKNFVAGAKTNHQEWLRKTIEAIENTERLKRTIGDQVGISSSGELYHTQLGKSINEQINSLAKSSSGFISKSSLNDDTIEVIRDLAIAKGSFEWGKKILSSIKTTSGSSLADLPEGQIALYKVREEINDNYFKELERNKKQREEFDELVKDEGQLLIFDMITEDIYLNPNQTVNVDKILAKLATTVSQDADGKPIHSKSSDLEYYRIFYPEFEEKLRAEASTYAKQLTDQNAPIFNPELEAQFLKDLDETPANTQPRQVLTWLQSGQIDYKLASSLMKVAINNKNQNLKGMNTQAFEDPIIKAYNGTKEITKAERYRKNEVKERNRDMIWRKSVHELWSRFDEGGNRLWDKLSDSEKESALQAIDKAIVQEQERLKETDAPEYPSGTQTIGINKALRVFFTPDGKIKTKNINGKEFIEYKIEDIK